MQPKRRGKTRPGFPNLVPRGHLSLRVPRSTSMASVQSRLICFLSQSRLSNRISSRRNARNSTVKDALWGMGRETVSTISRGPSKWTSSIGSVRSESTVGRIPRLATASALSSSPAETCSPNASDATRTAYTPYRSITLLSGHGRLIVGKPSLPPKPLPGTRSAVAEYGRPNSLDARLTSPSAIRLRIVAAFTGSQSTVTGSSISTLAPARFASDFRKEASPSRLPSPSTTLLQVLSRTSLNSPSALLRNSSNSAIFIHRGITLSLKA